jgi:HAE1 family hydrophobic/amphiphilic exporter-1
MSVAIAVSLFVSFTLTPMLAAQLLSKRKPGDHSRSGLERLVDVFYRPIERVYVRVLGGAMRHRWAVVVVSVLTLAAIVPLGKAARKGFLPIDDRAQFEVMVRLPEGRSVAATELVGLRVARMLREFPEVTATLLTVGDDAARTPNQARIYVKMTPPGERTITQDQFKDVVRQKVMPTLPKEWRVNIADVNEFGGGQATQRIQVLLAGPDLQVLERANANILQRMREVPGATDVDSTLVVGKPELEITVDRARAADLGVQVADVASALQLLVAGQKVSTFADRGEQYDIRLRATEDYRTQQEKLRLLNVTSRKVGMVSLADVVTIRAQSGPSTINRYARERQVTFMANGKPGADEGAIGEAVMKAIDAEGLPKGFSVKPQGQTKLMKETGISFVLGLLASFVFMYLILAAQFESWLHPVTILLSLPLTLPFAILSVILFKQALDLYSFLGIFVLFGVVKKNAILQIDHTNHLRSLGKPRLQAILEANRDRLRPILMTTLAFVAGMVPLLLSRGIGSGLNQAIAGIVVGGQTFSLLLTLLAVPVVYSLFDDVIVFFRRFRGEKVDRGEAELKTLLGEEHAPAAEE